MSGKLIILAGQRSVYNWWQQCYIHLYKNVLKNANAHNTVQYCISTKDRNRYLSKAENFTLDELETSNSYKNIKSHRKTQRTTDLKQDDNELMLHEKDNKNSFIYKRLELLYPAPKHSLFNIYTIVGNELNDKSVLTSSFKFIRQSQLWEFTYNVKWPETMSFKGVSKIKGIANKNAVMKCLYWLEMNNKLRNGKPIIYSSKEIKYMRLKPAELTVTPDILNDMKDLIKTYNTTIEDTIIARTDTNSYNLSYLTTPAHPILGDAAYTDILARNEKLRDKLVKRCTNNINLPIFEYRDEILTKLQNNRVLLIEGDTGCGKTTQVPQFIIDSFIKSGNATDCNILVSQPRRISAISLADRIAHEREENVGDVVGYQVRLEQILPKKLGGILFCTTGILLKKLQNNPNLEGCSHVILDEAHERSIDTDLLMILLKKTLNRNPDIKVLIMSATINAYMFQQYFNCPVIKVPGRLYPVEMNFLEDIDNLPHIQRYKTYNYVRSYNNEEEMLLVDCEKIVQVIKWISRHKPHGAILCFLPGWHEITKVQQMLEDAPLENERQMILPIHSKVSHTAQRKIFEHTYVGTRKIILATDIAETGITVSDVSYVVDSAIRKEMRWDSDKDIPSITNNWVSQANIHQRKGRAGRVKPGTSYHLLTKAEYNKLKPYPTAQILCNSLEKLVLDSKIYTDEKAEKFLSGLLEPPNSIAIEKAVSYLIDLGVMDEEENLTALGRRIVLFSTHPKLSKALVYASIFNCIHPITTIVSAFSGEDNLFYGVLDNKSEIRKNKKLYHPSSDHIALSWIYRQWITHKSQDPRLVLRFCKEMKLRNGRMEVLNQIRSTFLQQLMQCRLLPKNIIDIYNDCDDLNIMANKYSDNDELVRALLYSATQQLIEHKTVGFKNGVARTDINELRVQGQAIAVISGESVNYKRNVWPSPYLTYFHSAHCSMRRRTVIRETSIISPLAVLLFNQGGIRYKEENDMAEITANSNKRHILKFSCDKETAEVLLRFKNIIWSIVQYLLEKQGIEDINDNHSKQMLNYKNQLFKTLVDALHMSSDCIENSDDNQEQSNT